MKNRTEDATSADRQDSSTPLDTLRKYRYHLLLVIWCFAISGTVHVWNKRRLEDARGIPVVVLCALQDGRVNARACGAKGDGVTDDAEAIQRAMNVIAGQAGTVWFPRGTYVIKAPMRLPDNMHIEGAGENTVLAEGKR